MTEFKQFHSSLLKSAQWFSWSEQEKMDPVVSHWLCESASLSRRLALHCQHFSVKVLSQQIVSAEALEPLAGSLLGIESCLEREVILQGDGCPWVYARTFLPLSTMTDSEQDLAQLGSQPLGHRIFSHQSAHRDALMIAECLCDSGVLWARQSRLWIQGKPLLVAELFLKESPIYIREKAW